MMIAIRPAMPSIVDQKRSEHLADRLRVMDEEHEEIAADWMANIIPEAVLESWGPPDLSINLLAEISLQFSTPGLFGSTPGIDNAGSTETLVRTLEDMAYWSLMQRVEYLARGLGESMVRLEWLAGEGMSARIVETHNVYVRTHTDDPMRVIEYRELRIRRDRVQDRDVYTWDVFDISSPKLPTFRVMSADMTDELTGQYLPDVEGYPWMLGDVPFIPVVTYHSTWTGKFWNPSTMRGVYWGTLNAITFATYTGHSAHAATGSTVIISGLQPVSSGVDMTTDSGTGFKTAVLPPGAIVYHDTVDQQQPMVTEVGPGSNLTMLSQFTQGYSAQMLTRSGLSAPDASRTSASPTSGAALYISNKDKREASKRIEPSFTRSDLELLGKVAAMLSIQTGEELPLDGYSITYEHPPESPQEERDRRDEIDWKVARGMISMIDAYQELHPGSTREAALRALVRAQSDAADVTRAVEAVAVEVAGGVSTEKAQDTALNGAQVTAAQGIVESVAAGLLPRETGVEMLSTFFNMPRPVANGLMGTVGSSFKPTVAVDAAPLPTPTDTSGEQ